jgi:hypothetical protein|tara:strand:- start:215 stop:640 length:426 start_codon:yes stop_codon:yes gene_type:complete
MMTTSLAGVRDARRDAGGVWRRARGRRDARAARTGGARKRDGCPEGDGHRGHGAWTSGRCVDTMYLADKIVNPLGSQSRSVQSAFLASHCLGALRGGRGRAWNRDTMFSLLHVEYFFGFGMFILGMTKVSPSPAPSFARSI